MPELRSRCPTTTLGAGRWARSSVAKTPGQRLTGVDGQRLLEKVGGKIGGAVLAPEMDAEP